MSDYSANVCQAYRHIETAKELITTPGDDNAIVEAILAVACATLAVAADVDRNHCPNCCQGLP